MQLTRGHGRLAQLVWVLVQLCWAQGMLVKFVWGEEAAAPLLRPHEVSLCSSDGLGHSPDGLYARTVVEDESIADHC